MSEDSAISYSLEDSVAVVRLNRPQALNAINRTMRERLYEIFLDAEQQREVRALVLLGEGKAFCSGQDLKEGGRTPAARGVIQKTDAGDFQEALANMTKPTVAGLHGYTLGRGLLLALACDIRVGASDTIFALPEVQLGMLPGGGSTQRLPHLIGHSRALHLILTGNRIDAKTAAAWGLITELVNPADLETQVMNIARRLAANAPMALTLAKEAIQLSTYTSLAAGLKLEATFQSILHTTEDWQEGNRAFKERRQPKYNGY